MSAFISEPERAAASAPAEVELSITQTWDWLQTTPLHLLMTGLPRLWVVLVVILW